MIKNIIFDLSEVIISGYHGVEYMIEQNTNIKSEEFLVKKREVEDIFLETMRGKRTEDEYIEALLKDTNWNINKDIIKQLIRKNLDIKVNGTIALINKLKNKYILISIYVLISSVVKELCMKTFSFLDYF